MPHWGVYRDTADRLRRRRRLLCELLGHRWGPTVSLGYFDDPKPHTRYRHCSRCRRHEFLRVP